MEFVKFGLIGGGVAWKYHQLGIRNIPKMRFKSLFDIDEKNGKRVAKAGNMDYFSDLDKFFKSDIDAVIIMTPHYLHEQYVIAAINAGKHVLCEKPMATTLEGCDSMINAAKKAGVKFMIAENHRFLPAHKYIMEAVQSGLLGKIFLVRAFEGVNEIKGLMKKGFWKGHPIKAGGGALIDMGAHKFATLNWILNDSLKSAYSWITKQCTNLEEKAEDNAMTLLKYENGTIVEMSVSFSVVSPFNNNLELYGTEGTLIESHQWINPIRIFSNSEKMGKNAKKWFEPTIEHGPFPMYYELSMRNEDSHFTDCIINDTIPEFSPKQAREAIFDVLLCYLSAKKEKIVSREDLNEVYNTVGTKSILEGLEEFVHNNCPE